MDIELLRRLSAGSPLGEAEVELSRAERDYQEPVFLESTAKPRHVVPVLSDGEVAGLISQEARDAVIGFEVTGRKAYERKYIHPEAPAGQSGITIGIGYDLGYNTQEEARAHWQGLLPAADIEHMIKACGLKGATARARLSEFSSITVPWDAAIEVFQRSTMPRFGRMVLATYPNAVDTKGHAFGALFSLIYNRGPSLDGDRRVEMRIICELMARKEFAGVPAQFRAMAQLWEGKPGMAGVVARRKQEAILFQRGLENLGVPVVVARGGLLESAGDDASATPEQARRAELDQLHYELGLYSEASRRAGAPVGEGNLESVGGTQLEFGIATLKSIGGGIAQELERRLKEYVCGVDGRAALAAQTGVREQIDAGVKSGKEALQGVLVMVLKPMAFGVPESVLQKLVALLIDKVVLPAAGSAGEQVVGQLNQGCDWLCRQWDANIAGRYGPGGATAPPAPGSSPVTNLVTAIAPSTISPVDPPVAAAGGSEKLVKLFDAIATATAPGAATDPAGVRRLADEVRAEVTRSGATLTQDQQKTLLDILCDTSILHDGRGIKLYQLISEIEKLLGESPINQLSLAELVAALHAELVNSRQPVSKDVAKRLLKSLRDARQYEELSRVADRLLTRDSALQSTIAVPYAQGLIDTGRITAGVDVLTSALDTCKLTEDEEVEIEGLLGRAHKQVYVNFVRTPSDAMALSATKAVHLGLAAKCYAKKYDNRRPGENYWLGINLIALMKRAQRDRIPIDIKGDPEAMARAMIDELEPKAAATNDAYLLATIGEAYLALGKFDKAAEFFGKYAQLPGVKAFQLNSTIRQLEEVWQLHAEPTGAGAIVTGLKGVLAQKEGGAVTFTPAEQRSLQKAQRVQFQEHFETLTTNGEFLNFGLLQQIVNCCRAVFAVQKPNGEAYVNHGTAFLVNGADFHPDAKPDRSYLITNAHVMWDQAKADQEQMGSEIGSVQPADARILSEGGQGDGAGLTFGCAKVLWQSPRTAHDCVLFELDRPVPADLAKPLQLAAAGYRLRVGDGGTQQGTPMAVLGHPGGRQLAVSYVGSIQQNRAVLVDMGPRTAEDADPRFLHYTTPTEGGNSGSPVFATEDNWRLVGLHHAGFDERGGRAKLNGKPGVNFANEGILIDSIRAAIKAEIASKQKSRRRFFPSLTS